jgi:hypothetical protein
VDVNLNDWFTLRVTGNRHSVDAEAGIIMPRILTVLLLLHWAIAFSALAFLCMAGGDDGASSAFSALGISLPGKTVSGSAGAAFVSISFALCALLFWWALAGAALASSAETETDEISIVAFAAAAALMTILLVVGVAARANGVLPGIAIELCALLASFVAIGAAQRSGATTVTAGRLAARALAVDASRLASPLWLAFRDDDSRSRDR